MISKPSLALCLSFSITFSLLSYSIMIMPVKEASAIECEPGTITYPDSSSTIVLPSSVTRSTSLAFDSTNHRAYLPSDNGIIVLNTTDNSIIHTIERGQSNFAPYVLAINDATGRLFAADHYFAEGQFWVHVIDADTYEFVANITLQNAFDPTHIGIDSMTVNEQTNKVYLFADFGGSDRIIEIDGTTNTVSRIFTVSSGIDWANPLQIDAVDNFIYYGYTVSEAAIDIIDAYTGTTISTMKLRQGTQLSSMLLDHDGDKLYVGISDHRDDPQTTTYARLVMINTNTKSELTVAEFDGEVEPTSMALDSINGKLWIAQPYALNQDTQTYGAIRVYNTNSEVPELEKTYWIGRNPGPFHIFLDTNDGVTKAFATLMSSNQIVIIDYNEGCSALPDETPPETKLAKPIDSENESIRNGGYTLSTSMTFRFRGIDDSGVIASFECKLDDAPTFTPCTSPTTYTDLSYGRHIFRVKAIDGAGNTDATPSVWRWSILTPAQGVQKLINWINAIDDLDNGAKSSLLAPLKGIVKTLNDGNPSNDSSVCGKLDAFISEINQKEQSGDLTSEQALNLRKLAVQINSTIGCLAGS
jgi:DNA-binding beta-propeller fold protein YncE